MPIALPTSYDVAFYVYIMANKSRTTTYIGVTNDLMKRVQQHRNKVNPDSFSSRYNLNRLVYYERFSLIENAIRREKQLKNWRREKKDQLIFKMNPKWEDLFAKDFGFPAP